jgi:hypothetical protein
MACQAIANIVKTSLGPVGLDKVGLYSFDALRELDDCLIERDVLIKRSKICRIVMNGMRVSDT